MNPSPRQREVIELVGRDGMTYPEAAKALGIHISTVRVYVQRIIEAHELDHMKPRSAIVRLYWERYAPKVVVPAD